MNAQLKDGQLSRDRRFRWSAGWAQWVPVEHQPEVSVAADAAGQQTEARPPKVYAPYDELYVKQKRIRDRGGF